MRHPDEKRYCKLLRHDIFWGGCGGCYEVQEVREGNMDMGLFPESFDLDEAKEICDKCRWCFVNEYE